MPTPPVVVKAWQQKRAEPFKSRHQSVAISAFPIINLCQLCLAECVGFSREDDTTVSHPPKTAQIRQIKLDEKRDSRQKALGLFCVYGGFRGGRGAEQRSREKDENGLCIRRSLVAEK